MHTVLLQDDVIFLHVLFDPILPQIDSLQPSFLFVHIPLALCSRISPAQLSALTALVSALMLFRVLCCF